jgi:HPt (histidine-containing phosphotransfer) domain-containing protein
MDWLLVFFAAALMLMLGGALAFRGWWPGANRPLRSLEANAVPAPPEAPPDGAAEVLEYLHRLEAQGSPGLAADVIEIFMQDTSTRVTALRHAIDQGDGETVFRVAHTLQGSASMIGAVSVARSCDALAKSARSGSFDQCKVLVAELDARFEAIQRAMPVRRLTGPEQLR